MPSSVVVFGGSGFIGTHLLRRLVSEVGSNIISVDIKEPSERLPKIEYRIGDVRDLRELKVQSAIQRIYNLAAVHTTPGHADHEYFETNVAGALEVTSFAARYDVPEIIFTSSISVYGPDESVKTEETPLAPISAYGFSKALAERIHRSWLEADSSRQLTIVRPAVVFGKGEGGNFTRLAKLLQKGFFVYPGRKNTVKACIYVEDLLDAIEFARRQPERFVLFNASYSQRYTLEDIVNTLITKHFPFARTFMLPKAIVFGVAEILRVLDAFHLGIHPDRVTKLVKSTDVSPMWLTQRGLSFPDGLESALDRWATESDGLFR